jgi:type I restriction enzyme M protein
LVSKWAEQSKVNKEVKSVKSELEEVTVKAIESLSDEDIEKLLHKKWVTPICEGIHAILTFVLNTLEKKVAIMETKYSISYTEIENSLKDSEQNLASLIDQLTGDENAINGLSNLIKK